MSRHCHDSNEEKKKRNATESFLEGGVNQRVPLEIDPVASQDDVIENLKIIHK